MKRLPPLLALLLIFTLATAAQEVYKTVDEKGKVTFSDAPKDQSEKINTDLKNIHPPTKAVSTPEKSQKNSATPRKYTIGLTNPSQNQQFGPSAKTINIGTSLSPRLQPGHSLVFYMNGKQVAKSKRSYSTSVNITRNMRGQNKVSAAVVDNNGKRLATSNSVTIYVIRPN